MKSRLSCAVIVGLVSLGAQAATPVQLGAPKKIVESWRVAYDYDVRLDFTRARGLSFEVFCENALAFAGISMYLKSGDGWYSGKVNERILTSGRWHRVEIGREDFAGVEGRPGGWRDISRIRLSLSYGDRRERVVNTRFEIRNLQLAGERADVLVIGGATAASAGGGRQYSRKMMKSLVAVGVDARETFEAELAQETLADVRMVVLPWNPQLTDATLDVLETFVGKGGKLLVCGTFSPKLCALLGVRRTGVWYAAKAPKGERLTGFARADPGLPHQPAFAGQASWQTALLEPTGEGRVIARWAGADGKPSDRTAILLTPTGGTVGHAWFGPGEGRNELLAAMVGEMLPNYRETCASFVRACDERRVRDRAWVCALPPKAGERRLMWCHSARGMTGRSWDESARFLKERHFTDLIVNLVWGGCAYYRSEQTGVHPSVATDGDALEDCLAACRKHGIKCHVWQVSFRLGNEVDVRRMADYERDGRLQLNKDGEICAQHGRWFCPSHPANKREICGVMTELVRKGVDGIHFDYIRYQGLEGCYCARCRDLFEKKIGHAVARWPQDVLAVGELRSAWRDFRAGLISDYVRETSCAARRIRPGVEVSAAVFRNPRVGNFAHTAGQDWPTWCAEGWLDFVCPMDYCESSDAFRETIASQRDFAGKAKIYPGIGFGCWTDGDGALRRLGEQVLHCRDVGYGGWCLFDINAAGLDAVLSEHLGGLLK